MRPTIEEVAKRAGVSSPTVSRVLNGSKYVSPELSKRVHDAIGELNYHPDENARHLALNTTNSVGLIIPTLDDGEVAKFLAASAASFNEQGLEIMIGKTSRRSATELELVEAQLRSRVQGIIVVVPHVSDALRRALQRSGAACLFVYAEDPRGGFPSIVFDNEGAARALVESIGEPSRKRFAVISGPARDIQMSHRLTGCRDAFALLSVPKFSIRECEGTIDSGYSLAREIIVDDNPDVLMCLNDQMAIGALRAAHDHGIKVPDELEITGFAAGEYSTVCHPQLRTVRFDNEGLGRLTAQTLISVMRNERAPKLRVLGYVLENGGSCRPW